MAVASDGTKYRLNSDEYDALEAHDQVDKN